MSIKYISCFFFPDNKTSLLLKYATIPKKYTFRWFGHMTMKSCEGACHQFQECTTCTYNVKTKICALSNETHLSNNIIPSKDNWVIKIVYVGQ